MSQSLKPHFSFWVISGFGLLWSVMGCLNYLTQSNPENLAQLPEAYHAIIVNRPGWATAGFALAVFGGALGCLFLLFRRSLAIPVLALSALGVIVALFHAFLAVGTSPALVGAILSLVIAVALLWYARFAQSKGWIR